MSKIELKPYQARILDQLATAKVAGVPLIIKLPTLSIGKTIALRQSAGISKNAK